VPADILLSDAYNHKRRAMIGPTASLDQRPGVIPGYGMALAARIAGEGRVAVGSGGSGRAARPGVLVLESRVPESTVAELRRRRHIVEVGARVVGRTARRGGSRR
jgi:hypothetical protein